MAKDPAFLFYSDKFIAGTLTMTFEDRGKYITLMCIMQQQGRMNLEDVSFLVGLFDGKLKAKFKQDENGFFYSEFLEEVIDKRGKFTQSRVDNGSKGGRPKKENNLNETIEYPLGYEKDNLLIDLNIDTIKDVIILLNEITGSAFKENSKASQKHIRARLNEGYKIEDFRNVVSAKFFEWGNDSKMNKFLRPETLFGNKFEGYLQATKKIILNGNTESTGKQNNYNSTKAEVAELVRQARGE